MLVRSLTAALSGPLVLKSGLTCEPLLESQYGDGSLHLISIKHRKEEMTTMLERANLYPHRVNARLDDEDFETLKAIAREVQPIGSPSVTTALRHLIERWRQCRLPDTTTGPTTHERSS